MADTRVRYARNGSVRLAYRVWGDAEPTLVFVPGWVVSHVDNYDDPTSPYAPAIEQIAPVMRLVVWDKRGTGLSDPLSDVLSPDERMDDLRAVLDAAEVDTATLFGADEGGTISVLFAATDPHRVRSMVLIDAAARYSQDPPDFPWGFSAAEVDAQLAEIDMHWGEGALAELFYGTVAALPGVRDMVGKLQRSISSPTMARLVWQAFMQIDIRGVLDSVQTPTLVLVRPGDRLVPYDAVAALAAALPNAQMRALPPGEHHAFDLADVIASEIINFVCQTPSAPSAERILTTVLFTDIVDSTASLSAQGDAHWRRQLDVHDTLVDSLLSRYGGRQVKHTGDGVFALFDGPTKAARCGLELVSALATRDIRIRAGVHVGECERRGQEWSGLAVHVGARIGAMAGPGEVLASRTVRDLSAGSGLVFEGLGPQRLKGVLDEVDVYRVKSP